MFKFSIVELVDLYCIAKLKYQKLGQNKDELDFYQNQVDQIDLLAIKKEMEELYSIHSSLWDYENEFKRCIVDVKYSLEEIGRRSIIIRDMNLYRNKIKNEIADILNDPIKDIKQYG